jgi:IMP dehydrogenase
MEVVRVRIRRALSFNDVLLVPRHTPVFSRSDVDLSTTVAGLKLGIPIIAANMSSVCEADMAIALGRMGGLGIIHRMCSVAEEQEMLRQVSAADPLSPDRTKQTQVGFSIGIGPDWRDRMEACRSYAQIACLDVAHADSKRVLELLRTYFGEFQDYPLIIGNIATGDAARRLKEVIPKRYYETTALKVGIGGGSLCTTRIKTGFGVPTLQSVADVRELTSGSPDIIADGGISSSGDIVKSLVAGADAVMLGNLLAGTEEAPGELIRGEHGILMKQYRGSASFSDKQKRGEVTRNVEGESTLVPYRGKVADVIADLLDGVRSGLSYGGSLNIRELQDHVEFAEITTHGYRESLPHGKL